MVTKKCRTEPNPIQHEMCGFIFFLFTTQWKMKEKTASIIYCKNGFYHADFNRISSTDYFLVFVSLSLFGLGRGLCLYLFKFFSLFCHIKLNTNYIIQRQHAESCRNCDHQSALCAHFSQVSLTHTHAKTHEGELIILFNSELNVIELFAKLPPIVSRYFNYLYLPLNRDLFLYGESRWLLILIEAILIFSFFSTSLFSHFVIFIIACTRHI